jgi:hypothetical protein
LDLILQLTKCDIFKLSRLSNEIVITQAVSCSFEIWMNANDEIRSMEHVQNIIE